MKSKVMWLNLAGALFVCTQVQAQLLYETDFVGGEVLSEWTTTDDAWVHDPVAGTLTVAGAAGASAAYYGKLDLTDFTVTADVQVNNSAAAVVARFNSLSDPFYMCRYHPQDAILQLYLINTTTLLGSLPLAEMPDFDPAQVYAVSITVDGNKVTGRLTQGDAVYSVQATDATASSGFGGLRVWGPGENVFSHFAIFGDGKAYAKAPLPVDEATDVPRRVTLSWVAGEFASAHNVYLGTSFTDVNHAGVTHPLGVLVSEGQGPEVYDAGSLDFDQTYYWRVDEVNSTPDKAVFKGDIWSFSTEPYAYPITPVTATASSIHGEMAPGKTIDGSGLNDADLHGTGAADMWLTSGVDTERWIQYEFAKPQKLHEMWVWNSNQSIETVIGFGCKSVTIETSLDRSAWTELTGVPEFAQAPGVEGYAHNTVVTFGGVTAQYVKLTVNSGHGVMPQFGLSEVRFLAIPVYARHPQPTNGAAIDSVDVALTWRSGREADTHEVVLSKDLAAVEAGTAMVGNPADSSLLMSALHYDSEYFWRVNEVNDVAETPRYEGDIWSFSTPEYGVVDDFETYDDKEFLEIWAFWADGYNDPSNGALVGNGTIGERTIVHGGRQSMPIHYDNSSASMAEVTLSIDNENWLTSGIKTLSLYFQGDPGNTGSGTLYLKINDTKVEYSDDARDLRVGHWVRWQIDVSTVAGNLQDVSTLSIGVEGLGAVGVVYIDDIRLSPRVRTGIDIGSEGAMPNNGGTLAFQWIRSDYPDDVKGGAMFIGGLPSGADLRGLLAFSLAALKPGDVITDVRVSLFHGSNGTSNHQDGSIHSSSLELALITNPAYVNNRASWNNADQDTAIAWNTPGGDMGVPLATVTDLNLTTIDIDDEVAFRSTALTAAVQAAVDAGDSRIVFVLKSPELEASTTRNFFVLQGVAGNAIGPNLHIDLEE